MENKRFVSISEFLDYKHKQKKMPQDCEVILNDLQVLRELVNDFYSYVYEHCTRGKVLSDLYLTIDEQIDNVIKDVKGE